MDGLILSVKKYGKIKEAKIKLAPLVLFVGDNNSGKSYLTSLIWGLYNIGVNRLFTQIGNLGTAGEEELMNWAEQQINKAVEEQKNVVSLDNMYELFFDVINDCLDVTKNGLIKWIFNSDSVEIGELKICPDNFEDLKELKWEISYLKSEELNIFHMICGDAKFKMNVLGGKINARFVLRVIISEILQLPYAGILEGPRSRMANIYVPAARTGFMLTKDIVNKVGRDKTFNIQSEIEDEIEIAPFTKPINQFIDEICGLSVEHEKQIKTKELAEMIEQEMTHGSVEISNLPSREIRYLPEGLSEPKPLRVASAVVTELSPLILLFKHRPNIRSIFYEEPEMGLHPQLQQKMGKILAEMVNTGIRIVSTTHSDIILQHINNMIQLKKHAECQEICDKFGYTENDLLSKGDVRVYQMTDLDAHTTSVEELLCTEYGFEVPTFNDALDKIMNENYEIQE